MIKPKRKTSLIERLKTAILILSVACLVSCAHTTPIINERETIAYDGNDQNGGLIQDFDDGSTEITPAARDRYNSLILSQEGLIKYTRAKDFGITPLPNGNFRITAEAQEYWYSLKLEQEDAIE